MKFSNPQGEGLELKASAGSDTFTDENGVDEIRAAGIRTITPTGRQVYIKATENIYVSGEPLHIGEFIQVPESDAKRLVAQDRAVLATDAEVAEAQKGSKK